MYSWIRNISEYEIVAFCDSNSELWGNVIEDINIISVSDAADMCIENPEITVGIAVLNDDCAQEIYESIERCFPENTKIEFMNTEDYIENYQIDKAHKKLKYTWDIKLEKHIDIWVNNLMREVTHWVRIGLDKNYVKHKNYMTLKEIKYFVHPEIGNRILENQIVLDIGCGIISKYGSNLDDSRKVNIIPIDALAYFYNEINNRVDTTPFKDNYYCRFGLFEFVAHYFNENYADYIIIDNALDHCIDPYRSLIECLYVLKKGGSLHMKHRRAEAVRGKYGGLHQWNIDCIDDSFVIWDKEYAINISEKLKDIAYVKITYDKAMISRMEQYIYVEIVKIRDFKIEEFIDISNDTVIMSRIIDRLMRKFAIDSSEFSVLLNRYTPRCY